MLRIFTQRNHKQTRYVAIIGGLIFGSEAAKIIAENEFKVVVFEMNKLSCEKFEDGLPNWYINLRNWQMKEIDAKWDQLSKSFWCLSILWELTNFLNFEVPNFEIIWENKITFIIIERFFVLHHKGNFEDQNFLSLF